MEAEIRKKRKEEIYAKQELIRKIWEYVGWTVLFITVIGFIIFLAWLYKEKKGCCSKEITEKKDSILDEYDLDGDDTITNEELKQAKEIKEMETKLRKNLAQLRMARYTLIGMGVFTVAMFFVPIDR